MAVEFVHTLFNTVYFVVWFANGVLAEKLTCIRYSHLDGFVTIVHSFLMLMRCLIGALFNGLCSPVFAK